MRIAVVDDLAQDREWLAEKLRVYLQGQNISFTLLPFESGERFVAALEKTMFDIVFMDIYMGDKSGLEAAAALRRRSRECKLVFVTTSQEFLRQGYAYYPCHYLIKPASDADFVQAMENCNLKKQYTVPFLSVMHKSALLRLHTHTILYIDFVQRHTTIHTTDGVVVVTGGFGQVTEPLLDDERFLTCIKGVLVNMDFIARAEDAAFLLKNGERVSIALRTQKKTLKKYIAYSFSQMGEIPCGK